jgi:hypothetical protein
VSSALVSKPGELPGLYSTGLLDVCTVQRIWPDCSLCFMELVVILCDIINFECLLYCRALQTGVAATEYSITSLSVGYFH